MSGYTIIDVDTHVTERPDLWTSRAPARMRDQVPRIETEQRWTPVVDRGGQPDVGEPWADRDRWGGEFQEPAQELRGDAPRGV